MKAYELINHLMKLPCETEVVIQVSECGFVPIHGTERYGEVLMLQSNDSPEVYDDDGDLIGTVSDLIAGAQEAAGDE